MHHITADDREDDKKLLVEQVAGYVAKYATKATEALGVTLDHRIGEAELEDLDLPAHVAELVRACWKLGARPGLGELRLRKWAHMLGFGGHFSTKSRRYSTTLGTLRWAWVAYAIRRPGGHILPLDAWGGRRTSRPGSSLPRGPTSARVIRRRGRHGWLPRRLLGLGKRGGLPGRTT